MKDHTVRNTEKVNLRIQMLKKSLEEGKQLPPSRKDDLEEIRCKREESFRLYQRAKQIWEALEPSERDLIRRRIIADNPYYENRPNDSSLEMDCVQEVQTQLAIESHIHKT